MNSISEHQTALKVVVFGVAAMMLVAGLINTYGFIVGMITVLVFTLMSMNFAARNAEFFTFDMDIKRGGTGRERELRNRIIELERQHMDDEKVISAMRESLDPSQFKAS